MTTVGVNLRAVRLEGPSRHGEIRDMVGRRPRSGRLRLGVLGGHMVDAVGDPEVPHRLDLGTIAFRAVSKVIAPPSRCR